MTRWHFLLPEYESIKFIKLFKMPICHILRIGMFFDYKT